MVGKKAARAAPIRAFAPRSSVLGGANIRRRTSRSDGNPPAEWSDRAFRKRGSLFSRRDSSGVSGRAQQQFQRGYDPLRQLSRIRRAIDFRRTQRDLAIRADRARRFRLSASWVVNV